MGAVEILNFNSAPPYSGGSAYCYGAKVALVVGEIEIYTGRIQCRAA